MKKIILLFMFVSFVCELFSQQIPLKSLYRYSRLSYNPSEAGTQSFLPIYLSGRLQWQGIKDAPKTQDILMHGRVGNSIGLGGHFYNETAGITNRTGGNISLTS